MIGSMLKYHFTIKIRFVDRPGVHFSRSDALAAAPGPVFLVILHDNAKEKYRQGPKCPVLL